MTVVELLDEVTPATQRHLESALRIFQSGQAFQQQVAAAEAAATGPSWPISFGRTRPVDETNTHLLGQERLRK